MKSVILINPFTSVKYMYNFFNEKNIELIAFYTTKKLKRKGYILKSLRQISFHKEIYSENHNLHIDLNNIKSYIKNRELLYCFVCSDDR